MADIQTLLIVSAANLLVLGLCVLVIAAAIRLIRPQVIVKMVYVDPFPMGDPDEDDDDDRDGNIRGRTYFRE